MSRISVSMSVILLILCVNGIVEIDAVPTKAKEGGQFFNKLGDKIVQTATTIKEYLLELFYRFRAFFMGHSQTTHQEMASRGCGYATEEQPNIYHKQQTISKIKGGDDAIWHTW